MRWKIIRPKAKMVVVEENMHQFTAVESLTHDHVVVRGYRIRKTTRACGFMKGMFREIVTFFLGKLAIQNTLLFTFCADNAALSYRGRPTAVGTFSLLGTRNAKRFFGSPVWLNH